MTAMDHPTLFDEVTPIVSGQPTQDQAAQAQARYEERKAARDVGLAKVQTWEWERMVLPRGTTRRTRQKVTVRHNPNGWRRDTSGYSQVICKTLMQFDGYPHPPGKTWREQWDEDHGTHKVPPYGDIVPKDPDKRLTAGREALIATLRQAGLGAGERSKDFNPALRLQFSKAGLTAIGRHENREAIAKLPCKWEGADLEIGFNLEWVLDGLNALDDQLYRLGLRNRAGGRVARSKLAAMLKDPAS